MLVGFDTPVFNVSGFFTYITQVTLTEFDVNLNMLGTVSSAFAANLALSEDPASSPNELLSFTSGTAIAFLSIASTDGNGFVLDDLTYDTSSTPAPEPGTLSLMCLGMAALLCRRRVYRSA